MGLLLSSDVGFLAVGSLEDLKFVWARATGLILKVFRTLEMRYEPHCVGPEANPLGSLPLTKAVCLSWSYINCSILRSSTL